MGSPWGYFYSRWTKGLICLAMEGLNLYYWFMHCFLKWEAVNVLFFSCAQALHRWNLTFVCWTEKASLAISVGSCWGPQWITAEAAVVEETLLEHPTCSVLNLGAPGSSFHEVLWPLRNPNDLTSEWFLKASGSGPRVGVVLPSKCLNYVNGLDLAENLGRKQSSSKGGKADEK